MEEPDKNYGLEQQDLINLLKIFRDNNKITRVTLFGSRAKGIFRTTSDVDLALEGYNLNLKDSIDVSLKIDKLNLPYRFDLILFDKIEEQLLIDHIRNEGNVLFERENASKF